MLGEIPGEQQSNGCLSLTGGDCTFLVVAGEAGSLLGELLEGGVDEGVPKYVLYDSKSDNAKPII